MHTTPYVTLDYKGHIITGLDLSADGTFCSIPDISDSRFAVFEDISENFEALTSALQTAATNKQIIAASETAQAYFVRLYGALSMFVDSEPEDYWQPGSFLVHMFEWYICCNEPIDPASSPRWEQAVQSCDAYLTDRDQSADIRLVAIASFRDFLSTLQSACARF